MTITSVQGCQAPSSPDALDTIQLSFPSGSESSSSMYPEALDLEKAKWLESNIIDEMYDLPLEASLWCDLLGTALARVDWLEVIEKN